jgi:hypothetical protein
MLKNLLLAVILGSLLMCAGCAQLLTAYGKSQQAQAGAYGNQAAAQSQNKSSLLGAIFQ